MLILLFFILGKNINGSSYLISKRGLLVDKELIDYIREQARNKIHPNVVKHNLINRGWSKGDVEKAIKEGYAKKEPYFAVTMVLVLIVGFLVLLIVSLSSKPIDKDYVENLSAKEQVVVEINQDDGCHNIVSSIEKDRCYNDELAEGFDCNSLTNDSEKNFCFRALEYRVLNN